MSAKVHLNIGGVVLLFVLATAVHSVVFGEDITPSPYWKNEISFPNEPFRVVGGSASEPDWVKFTIILPPYDPNIVYHQDCQAYTFHYHFATEVLDPLIGMSTSEYDQITLYDEGQQAVLGAVIMPPSGGYPTLPVYPEYGIQFVRLDPYTREEIAEMFNVVKASVIAEPDVQAFYFPSYEQLSTAEANREWFESQGILLGSTARWAEGNACYSKGWALGELKFFAGDDIEDAYLAGDLLPGDILLTDGVPAEIPFVAGIITLSPSTPNSHVAILAKTYGVPFVHLALAEDANRAQELVGHTILLCVDDDAGVADVGLRDVGDLLTEEEIDTILAVKAPPVLDISPMADYGAYSASTEGLLPADIKYFGGKAANYGILRAALPDKSPVAVAFSFDLWNEFLDQTIFGGNTLREEIFFRLSSYSYPPADMEALSWELEGIREDLFKNKYITSFTPQQEAAIIATLEDANYGFDAFRNIRFRSSTNVEDSNQFTGAGLYESFSGCLADDLDGDNYGPCLCDPNEENERGVFRAIRKVFASFYNDNAYLERLRHYVNEDEVGMALLVHHSFPDEYELANGVATLEKEESDPNRYIVLVTQDGATSVANPSDGSIPEEVSVVYVSSPRIYPKLERGSNLVMLGATVMDWQDDYNDLSRLLVAAADEFEQVTGKSTYILDFEYKKLSPGGAVIPAGGLVVKQIRQIPSTGNIPTTTTPFLINESIEYSTFQYEMFDVFALHRLKSRWRLETKNMWLTPENLEESFYAEAYIEYAADGRIRTLEAKLPLLPFAFHWFDGEDAVDGWKLHHLSNPRVYSLYTNNVPTEVSPTESPVLTLRDFYFLNPYLHSEYTRAVPSEDGTTTTDEIRLWEEEISGWFILQERTYYGPGDISISTSYYREAVFAGTGVLSHFVETVIYGYTTKPIVLHGYYSQTYGPEHHNWCEDFLFEPQLEPGISQNILEELQAQDIRLIHVFDNCYETTINTYGFDDKEFYPADIDGDDDTDLPDFALLAGRWGDSVCDDCGGADLNGDGRVTGEDLWEMSYQWLAGVE
jgi:hypothetical protein